MCTTTRYIPAQDENNNLRIIVNRRKLRKLVKNEKFHMVNSKLIGLFGAYFWAYTINLIYRVLGRPEGYLEYPARTAFPISLRFNKLPKKYIPR